MEQSLYLKTLILITVGLLIAFAVSALYNPANRLYDTIHSHSYSYLYLPFGKIESTATAYEPAVAVPVLMYHGVRVVGELGANTTRENFIDQMEMLKREGYETITVKEYDLFREGEFTLPPKPILLTFDDGRKDSYYTVDEVLRKLGFKATMFSATIKPNTDDPFYLGWNELRKLKDTGRWEIEAHGQHSHDKVQIDADGTIGRYLSSRIYDPETGLESIADFEDRVEMDYIDGIKDLYVNLGIDPRYYAVPLNDYGDQVSNYDDGVKFNKYLTKHYFKLAFVQSLVEDNIAKDTFYNYADTDPYNLKRLEVKNMTADELLTALKKYEPSWPSIAYPEYTKKDDLLNNTFVPYGRIDSSGSDVAILAGTSSRAARAIIGDRGWQDYEVQAKVDRNGAHEVWMILYYQDEENMVLIDIDYEAVTVTELIDNEERLIAHVALPAQEKPEELDVLASIQDGLLSINVDGVTVAENEAVKSHRGAPAIGFWDPEADGIKLSNLFVLSLK